MKTLLGQSVDPFGTPVLFSKEELWYLHAFVRHEMPSQNEWKIPPASRSLNEDICMGLLFCEEEEQANAWASLTEGDCLVIDYFARPEHKSPGGQPIGKAVLLKTFAARMKLNGGIEAGPAIEPSQSERDKLIDLFKEHYDASTNDHPDDDARVGANDDSI